MTAFVRGEGELILGIKSLELTLDGSGIGSVPIPDTAHLVGVKPATTTLRVGLEAPEVEGAATGAAVATDLKKGIPADSGTWLWMLLRNGTGRVLYVKGGAGEKSKVAVV